MDSLLQDAVNAIVRHGWMVQVVSDLGCGGDHGGGNPPASSGSDPYLYTVGLTAAGLPELLLRLPGRNSSDWVRAGQRMLNGLAAHTLHEDLVVGQVLPVRGGLWVRVAEPPVFSREPGAVWPGMAFRLYGQRKVRVLELVPAW